MGVSHWRTADEEAAEDEACRAFVVASLLCHGQNGQRDVGAVGVANHLHHEAERAQHQSLPPPPAVFQRGAGAAVCDKGGLLTLVLCGGLPAERSVRHTHAAAHRQGELSRSRRPLLASHADHRVARHLQTQFAAGCTLRWRKARGAIIELAASLFFNSRDGERRCCRLIPLAIAAS